MVADAYKNNSNQKKDTKNKMSQLSQQKKININSNSFILKKVNDDDSFAEKTTPINTNNLSKPTATISSLCNKLKKCTLNNNNSNVAHKETISIYRFGKLFPQLSFSGNALGGVNKQHKLTPTSARKNVKHTPRFYANRRPAQSTLTKCIPIL